MVVTAASQMVQQGCGELRPIDPTRDLKAIADLIADAFAGEMDEHGRAALRELRWMARLSPFVWWWSQTDPDFRDAFNGFVWEIPLQGGRRWRVVGNVNLNRAPGNQRQYIICNVVVQDSYRGQGVGRRLIQAAIAEAHDLGAEGIVLQVHEDNAPALQLYTDLGFAEAAGEIDLRLNDVSPVPLLEAPGYRFRRWQPGDGQAVLQLAQQVTPPVQQWLRPVKAGDHRPGGWLRLVQWLAGLMAGQRVYRLTALRDERVIGMMAVTCACRHGDHRLAMLVHPDHNGQVEAALVSRALNMLGALPSRPLRATMDKGHTALFRALLDYGFQEQRTLLTLRKDLLQGRADAR